MLIPLFLAVQLALVPDSVYSTAALRALVAGAVVANHAPPQALQGYRARIETELSLILRDTLGRERAAQIEQLASSARWRRGGEYDVHVVGYRTQGIGPQISTLSFVRGWTTPSLYGERLTLGAELGGARDRDTARSDTVVAVHPFAADRELFYRYSGGDTIAVLHTGARTISIVRIRVMPHLRDTTRYAALDGEIDLDAERGQIVRMRGQFVVLGRYPGRRPLLSRLPGLVGVAYGEFVNKEVQGRYWLPEFQRTELQSTVAMLGHTRAVMRIVSRFTDYDVDDSSAALATGSDDQALRRRTTWASGDSVSRFRDWHAALGDATTSVTADDFSDVAPDAWRTTGGARLDLVPTKIDNVVRYDRVEGLFTGVEANLRMRSVVPGLSVGGSGGWAWTERTLRGESHVVLQRDPLTLSARAERMLATTNDFVRPLDPQNGGIAALIGSVDDFDYVDRRVALASATRVFGSLDRALATVQLGVGDDRAEVARLTRGALGGGSFRPNRGVAEGSYALGVLDVELHPNATGEFIQPGVGANLRYEAGRGTLQWQRAELSLAGRKYWGPVALLLQADGGAVFGSAIPPQKLFELGGGSVLPGYEYKEFAGDRAALFRGYGSYTFSLWRTPRRVWRSLWLPGLAPGMAAGVQGGWTDLSSDAARAAVAQLGAPWSSTPVSRATDGVRATIGFGITLFSGSAHLGLARPVDRPAPWKLVAGVGPAF
jgi:hypothetical protein